MLSDVVNKVIIAGAGRAGKSTLSKQIAEKIHASYIPFDPILCCFTELYPEHGINYRHDPQIVSRNVKEFMKIFLERLEYTEGISFVIDVHQFFPVDIIEVIDDTYYVYCLGYPHADPKEKLHFTRKFEKEYAWTKGLSDEEMLHFIGNSIHESQIIKKQCEEYDLEFIDTSTDFTKTIDSVVRKLINKIEKSL